MLLSPRLVATVVALLVCAGVRASSPAGHANDEVVAAPAEARCESPSVGAEVSGVAIASASEMGNLACIPPEQCCRICTRGQACGNSCISAAYTCRKGRGCACDSFEVCR